MAFLPLRPEFVTFGLIVVLRYRWKLTPVKAVLEDCAGHERSKLNVASGRLGTAFGGESDVYIQRED